MGVGGGGNKCLIPKSKYTCDVMHELNEMLPYWSSFIWICASNKWSILMTIKHNRPDSTTVTWKMSGVTVAKVHYTLPARVTYGEWTPYTRNCTCWMERPLFGAHVLLGVDVFIVYWYLCQIKWSFSLSPLHCWSLRSHQCGSVNLTCIIFYWHAVIRVPESIFHACLIWKGRGGGG